MSFLNKKLKLDRRVHVTRRFCFDSRPKSAGYVLRIDWLERMQP